MSTLSAIPDRNLIVTKSFKGILSNSRSQSHCRLLHAYNFKVILEYTWPGMHTINRIAFENFFDRLFGVSGIPVFSNANDIRARKVLTGEQFTHIPLYVGSGCEGIAYLVYSTIMANYPELNIQQITVVEHESNSAGIKIVNDMKYWFSKKTYLRNNGSSTIIFKKPGVVLDVGNFGFRVTFVSPGYYELHDDQLNQGWVVDFGALKSFKRGLEDIFDHTAIFPEDQFAAADEIYYNTDTFEQVEAGFNYITINEFWSGMRDMLSSYAMLWVKDNGFSKQVDHVKIEHF